MVLGHDDDVKIFETGYIAQICSLRHGVSINVDGQDPNHSTRKGRGWCGGALFLFFDVLILCTIARILLVVDLSTAPTSFAILHPPIALMVHAFFALRSLLALSFASIF